MIYERYQLAKDYGFYDPMMCGSIDATDDTKPHDHGIIRALNSTHYKPNLAVKSDPDRTLFIGRINYKTQEKELEKIFTKFGKHIQIHFIQYNLYLIVTFKHSGSVRSFRLVRDIVTGFSKGYAFVEFKHRSDAKYAHEKCYKLVVDDRELLVEFEHERNLKGWKPRRLGGGFGGFKESGQLRFGGRYKPFGKIYQPRNTPSHDKNLLYRYN